MEKYFLEEINEKIDHEIKSLIRYASKISEKAECEDELEKQLDFIFQSLNIYYYLKNLVLFANDAEVSND